MINVYNFVIMIIHMTFKLFKIRFALIILGFCIVQCYVTNSFTRNKFPAYSGRKTILMHVLKGGLRWRKGGLQDIRSLSHL